MDITLLSKTAQAMVAPGKGILAIDESGGTCKKRFDELGVECNEENRRLYRQMLVTAPEIEKYISGYILFDETLRQKTDDGTPFPEVLKRKGIMPGIKADAGLKELALYPGEKVSEGLDGLRERLAEWKKLGAVFAKWRVVVTIKGDGLPSDASLMANSHTLARYAALCQEADIVPMVEPEILLEGDHTIQRCYDVSAKAWKMLFEQLEEQGVALEGTILKTSMVVAGKACPTQADREDVAKQTLKCLLKNIPKELAGVVFLSGGLSDADSTVYLNMINQIKDKKPWPLSFSYGRGIQRPALKIWAANKADVAQAQKALVHRANMNGLASLGQYSETMEK
ncbi:MAG: class I fructose-bisphosphate aldolase [Candidatus Peregrinibacteria bacterium]